MSQRPLLTTERLELWKPRFDDMRAVYELVTHPRTATHLGPPLSWTDHYARFHRNAGGWYFHGYGNFLVRERGQSRVIGNIGIFHSNRGLGDDFDLNPEAGWIMAHDHVGKGYASEAMTAILAWFDAEHGPRRIVCIVSPQNAPSLRMAEKFGFVPLRMANMPTDGEPVQIFERLPREAI
ncbi:GNAT family N-acetyltransferase [Croceibacterium aestuarii]|uniref:GNAT family N-acetyltransferase n=1 Tax=Croceibacterium aestuarii TaxID=3064139 RepID=UPI00272E9F36|nr:GNAT family N-acetyltransferase [Croceibacterium sp. D39]